MKTLRRRLFGSHLLVMVVAIGVLLIGVALAIAFVELVPGVKMRDLSGAPGTEPSDGNPLVLLLPAGAAAAAAGLVSWRVARRLAAPIEAARGATRQLASGNYGVEVDGGDVAELAELAADINRLGAELEATERRRLRLIGDVAHELRNPLATIEASMEALMDGVIPADDETFAGIAREAARLRRLSGDLSELSATAEPSVIGEVEAVDLSAVIGHVVDQLGPQAQAKGLRFRWTPVPGLVVLGDRDRLVQVFTNVIGNAVQYTEAGEVTIDTERTPSAVVVTVADTGRGLDPEQQARIFERFHRVDNDTEGTGVGLAIARSLITGHRGTIEVDSAGLGHGTRFTIGLPTDR
ncbi:MAG: HAMP domain-containing sensor histidine kinase [Actinomycetota bacterium]